jgi:hypothetical protein
MAYPLPWETVSQSDQGREDSEKRNRQAGEKALERNLQTIGFRGLNPMKKLPFQQRGQLPITLKIRILKFWNLTVCSVHSALHPITTQSPRGEGK